MVRKPAADRQAITIRIDRDVLSDIDDRVLTNDMSREETIRRMLRWALDQPQPKAGKR